MKTQNKFQAIYSRLKAGHAAYACALSESSPPKKNTSASCDSPPTAGTSPSSTPGTNCATPSSGCCENQPSGIEAAVCSDITRRQQMGIKKYGTTVADNPLTRLQWMKHFYEELLDAAIYAKKQIMDMEKEGK